MYTRSSTYYQKGHNGEWEKIPNVNFKASTPTMSLNLTTLKLEYSENGVMMPVKTGLDFMIKDESIRELMFSLLVDLPAVTDAQKTLLGVVLTRKLVNQYYDAKHDKTEEAKKAFLKVKTEIYSISFGTKNTNYRFKLVKKGRPFTYVN
jgi:hypothetical protein